LVHHILWHVSFYIVIYSVFAQSQLGFNFNHFMNHILWHVSFYIVIYNVFEQSQLASLSCWLMLWLLSIILYILKNDCILQWNICILYKETVLLNKCKKNKAIYQFMGSSVTICVSNYEFHLFFLFLKRFHVFRLFFDDFLYFFHKN
jgi:hypothetical protein